MADDRDARIAQLEAELAVASQREAALQGQLTETADVLRAMAVPGQYLHSTLASLQDRAQILLDASSASIYQVHDGLMRRLPRPVFGPFETSPGWAASPIDRGTIAGRAILDRQTQHVLNVLDPDEVGELHPDTLARMRRFNVGSFLAVPLLRGGEAIGALLVARTEVRAFSKPEIALLETFADQAVIAIENARLFEELEQRNTELQESNRQVTEALEQQTATAEVLRVIASSPTDLQRVLDAIVESAARLCDAPAAALQQLREHDQQLAGRALYAARREDRERLLAEGGFEVRAGMPATPDSVSGRAFVEARTIHVHDLAEAVQTEYPAVRDLQARYGQRTLVCVPLLRRGQAIGVLSIQRFEVRPFSDQQIALLEAFADQAVIAIENARLFSELERRNAQLQDRTTELQESNWQVT
jgi:GAF domain-containing protein